MARIFISYSHKDSEFVELLDFILQKEGPAFDVFRDIRQPASRVQSIVNHPCDFFVPVISRNYRESQYCQMELRNAINRSRVNHWPQIVPVMIDTEAEPIVIGGEELVHYNLHWPDSWREEYKFYQELEKLKHRLRMSAIKGGYLDFSHASWYFSPANELKIVRDEKTLSLSFISPEGVGDKAVVLTYFDWIDLSNYRKVMIRTSGVEQSSFSLWGDAYPKMLKMEIDGNVISPPAEHRVADDASYLKPASGEFVFELERELRGEQKRKVEFVLGANKLNNFSLQAKFLGQ